MLEASRRGGRGSRRAQNRRPRPPPPEDELGSGEPPSAAEGTPDATTPAPAETEAGVDAIE
jgi:hypothetical protein